MLWPLVLIVLSCNTAASWMVRLLRRQLFCYRTHDHQKTIFNNIPYSYFCNTICRLGENWTKGGRSQQCQVWLSMWILLQMLMWYFFILIEYSVIVLFNTLNTLNVIDNKDMIFLAILLFSFHIELDEPVLMTKSFDIVPLNHSQWLCDIHHPDIHHPRHSPPPM